ncbi:CRISPR-associated protein, Cse4 family [Methanosalsum zhilinae DSM 4017]|uniref:CRISPR-associated protein, Cse4 family n=1 Tax=Methanosalsum zhilinae (strain DSM 4017 / NBRC 107636 / OCM 62 / WeN5) TaxID=679901 RepID=F7XPH3_METZD|nr:type I-E CRISPR-associated protein Cas7/Cse4/CasC [Methanosalsum zhilinae]AEH61398.1 CRISPR-associated protein, Cse4 family [Methanosalsum zhilinae DSM 4017]
MSKFVQIHTLVSYPPSNLNRDDLGRPKTAIMGGTQRLRISSQSLKRAWRTSDIFKEKLDGNIGIRTKSMGVSVFKALTNGFTLKDFLNNGFNSDKVNNPVEESVAKEWAKAIADVFGKIKKENKNNPLAELEIEQLAHFSPEEITSIDELMSQIAQEQKKPSKEDIKKLDLLKQKHTAVDIAMFGRMLASDTMYNTEAAVQVSHAITANKVAVEDDYFTAVDDLNKGEENMGSGHLGENEFGSGLFYTYICVDKDLLESNLGGDKNLVSNSLKALIEAASKVSPTGKQNSFASRSYASYVMVEKGNQQPRSLAVSYLKSITGDDMLKDAIDKLETTKAKMDQVYGPCADEVKTMNVYTGEGNMSELMDFISN